MGRIFGVILPTLPLSLVLALLLALPAAAAVGERAKVQDDGTLRVNGRTIHLFGIYIPTIAYTCRSSIRPSRCAPRAVFQLDSKIRGFVYCDQVQRFRDGSRSAVCRTGRHREDLAAWLLTRGWAVALPGAPIEYITLERFAEANRRGFWGFRAHTRRHF